MEGYFFCPFTNQQSDRSNAIVCLHHEMIGTLQPTINSSKKKLQEKCPKCFEQWQRPWSRDMCSQGNFFSIFKKILTFLFNLILFTFLYSRFLLLIHFIHISVYMSIPISQFIISPSPPPAAFPPWCPYVCSLHLCLYFCPGNRFICTIFLGSTYMR